MVRLPSLAEFIKRAKEEYGANVISLPNRVSGPRGPVVVNGLVRTGTSGETVFADLPEIPHDSILSPQVLRGLCDQLGIPPDDFGLHLEPPDA
jgi:hypothetical protein